MKSEEILWDILDGGTVALANDELDDMIAAILDKFELKNTSYTMDEVKQCRDKWRLVSWGGQVNTVERYNEENHIKIGYWADLTDLEIINLYKWLETKIPRAIK